MHMNCVYWFQHGRATTIANHFAPVKVTNCCVRLSANLQIAQSSLTEKSRPHCFPRSASHTVSTGSRRHILASRRLAARGIHCTAHDTVEEAQEPEAVSTGPVPKKGTCYGCGAALQTEQEDAAGYVAPEKYELKRAHRQLNQLVCRRCQGLSNGAMLPGVEDLWGRDEPDQAAARRLVSPAQLRAQLARVRERRAVAVLLVDLLDASGSFLGKVRDLVGRNPIVLVGTKADLLPKGAPGEGVRAWLEATAQHKRLSPIGTFLVSSRTGEGIAEVVKAVRVERRGRDVYIMGAANVGKSAFVRAFVQEMSNFSSAQFDPAAIGTAKRLPVESAMPGTTLELIPLQAFDSGGLLYDTPGVHLQHRLQHLLEGDAVKQLLPKGPLKSFTPPSPQQLAERAQAESGSPNRRVAACGTYFWGGLARVDVLDAPLSARLVFYGPKALRVQALPLVQGDGSEKSCMPPNTEVEGAEQLLGALTVHQRGGLRVAKEAVLNVTGRGPVLDIAISGLPGWVAVQCDQDCGRLQIRVWTPPGIEAYLRPPLPAA